MFLRKKKKAVMPDSDSHWQMVLKNFKKDKVAVIAALILLVIALSAAFADVLFDYEAQCVGQNMAERNLGPCREHIMGTDSFGRDIFARIVFGARYSLMFGIGCTVFSLFAGSVLGAVAAYWRGVFDNVLMRFLDAWMCIPSMLMMLLMVAVLGVGLMPMIIAITISSIPGFTRMVRSVVLTIVAQDYIEAARVSGQKDMYIIFRHVLPNAVGSIIVNGMMSIAGIIMSAAGLSYIGMGIQPPIPEWGNMLNEGTQVMRMYPQNAIFPGIAIIITALCFNLIGDGLADAMDPRRHNR